MRLSSLHPALPLVLAACTSHQTASVQHDPPPPPTAAIKAPVRVAPVPEPATLDPHALAPASVAGVVRDLEGQPVAAATVCAWNIDPHADDLAPRCAATDSGGAYTIDGLVPRHHELHASAPARQTVGTAPQLALRPGERRTAVDHRLAPGGVALTGVVRTTRGGPLADAWVTNFPAHERRVGGAAAARTAADGSFTLWVSPGPQRLFTHAPGFARAAYVTADAPARELLALAPESAVTGKVVDVRGAAIVGARVVATSHGSTAVAGVAHTDATGSYRIGGLDPGLYRARATSPSGRGHTAWPVRVGPEASAALEPIVVQPAASVAGRLVVAGTGETCPLGQVTLHAGAVTDTELAGPDGEVYFAAVPPGEHRVTASCPGTFAPDFPAFTVGDAAIRALAWEFMPGQDLRGVVVDAAGAPLPGVPVRVYPLPMPDDAPRDRCQTGDDCDGGRVCDDGNCVHVAWSLRDEWLSAPSDATGAFTVTGVPPGNFHAAAVSFVDTPVDAKPSLVTLGERGGADVRVVAAPSLRLGGLVVDARGAPVAGAAVHVLLDRGATLRAAGYATTDADGRFLAVDLEPGHYRVRAAPDIDLRDDDEEVDDMVPAPRDVRVTLDARGAPDVRVTLRDALGQIRGVVRGPDGQPVPGAFVEVNHHLDVSFLHGTDRATRTDAAGAFTLERLPVGAYWIRAHTGDDADVVLPGRVRTGQRVTLALPAAHTLSGRLTGDRLPEHFTVELHRTDLEFTRSESFTATGGRWSLPGVPVGSYELYVSDGDRRAALVVSLTDAARSGLELTLRDSGQIRGKLVDADLKTPLSGVDVELVHLAPALRTPPWHTGDATDADGDFVLRGVFPGDVELRFPGFEPASVAATLAPGATLELAPTLRLADR